MVQTKYIAKCSIVGAKCQNGLNENKHLAQHKNETALICKIKNCKKRFDTAKVIPVSTI